MSDPGDLGRFAVSASGEEVAAFAQATGHPVPADGVLPATFPMRWLAAPQVRAVIAADLGEAVVPFHESQSFAYAKPLVSGRSYAMSVAVRRESAPDRLVVFGRVAEGQGPDLAVVETVLRLFAVPA